MPTRLRFKRQNSAFPFFYSRFRFFPITQNFFYCFTCFPNDPIQVNGKRRGSITLAMDASETDAVVAARALPTVVAALAGKEPKRVVYVPGKVLNLVV